MKLSELKHNHSLTDLLKILLFAILMLAPIGMVATRCLYVIANKNAYQSYSGNITERQNVEYNDNTPLYDVYFTFNNEQVYANQPRPQIYFSDYEVISTNISAERIATLSTATYLKVWVDNETNYINWDTLGANLSASSWYLTIKLDVETITNSNETLSNSLLYRIVDLNGLDNVFEYSVSQLEESSLFNWTENTAIFSGVQTMTTQLGITNQTIPILLVYWFLLTVIYVIIDIILKLFTYMTHAIGSRKA